LTILLIIEEPHFFNLTTLERSLLHFSPQTAQGKIRLSNPSVARVELACLILRLRGGLEIRDFQLKPRLFKH
jgi:hypothetical protein